MASQEEGPHQELSHGVNLILDFQTFRTVRNQCPFFKPLSVFCYSSLCRGFPGGSPVKIRVQCRRCRRCGFDPWVGKIPWKRAYTLVFLPGESSWTEECGRLQSIASQQIRHDWSDWARAWADQAAYLDWFRPIMTKLLIELGVSHLSTQLKWRFCWPETKGEYSCWLETITKTKTLQTLVSCKL